MTTCAYSCLFLETNTQKVHVTYFLTVTLFLNQKINSITNTLTHITQISNKRFK